MAGRVGKTLDTELRRTRRNVVSKVADLILIALEEKRRILHTESMRMCRARCAKVWRHF